MFAVHLALLTAAIIAVLQILNLDTASKTPSIQEMQEYGRFLFLECVVLLATFVLIIRQMINAYDHRLWIILASVFFLLCLLGGRWDTMSQKLSDYEKITLVLYVVAFAAPYIRFRKIAMVTILLTPAVTHAQSFVEADVQYGESGLWPRGSLHLHMQTNTDLNFLVTSEATYREALLMLGPGWETHFGDIGFVVGSFLEPTEVLETEHGYEGPTAFGFGGMLAYAFEKEVFHLLVEAGTGYNFDEWVPLYDVRMGYLVEGWSLGARAHYELGYGPTLGYQLGEHWLVNASGFIKEHRTPTYLAGIAYCIGTNRH